MTTRTRNLPRMATRQQAREALIRWASQFQQRRNTRLVFMGDGRGTAASNIQDPNMSGHVLVRPNLRESRGYFSVKNKRVTPEFNKPVLLGYLDEEPEEEQILSVNDVSLEWTASGIDVIQRGQQTAHHKTHEWGGADTVFVDSRQMLPGLVTPTNPPSMRVQVQPFTFFHKKWNSYPGGLSADLSAYKPTSGFRYILISFDPEGEALQYGIGSIFTGGGFGGIVGGLTNVPEPTGDSYPLGIILLQSTTTIINWDQHSIANLSDARLHINIPTGNIFARIEELENTLGLDHDATTTGAGASSSGDLLTNAGLLRGVNILDVSPSEGQFLKYDINSNSWRPASGAGGGSGTNTHASVINLGTGGYGLYKETVAGQHQFKTILAGTNITLASGASDVTINATGGGGIGESANLGGVGLFREKSGGSFLFKGLSANLIGGDSFAQIGSDSSRVLIAALPRERSFTFTIGASNSSTWNNKLIPIWRGPRSSCATLKEIFYTASGGGELDFQLQLRDSITLPGKDVFGASLHATSQNNSSAGFTASLVDTANLMMFTTGSAVESGSVAYVAITVYYEEYGTIDPG